MLSRTLSALLRPAIELLLRLLAVFAIFRAGREAARGDGLARVARAREGETEAALARPRDRGELVRRLRERGL